MIRNAKKTDLPALYQVCQAAKACMARSGNPAQWEPGYPENCLEEDIDKERLYVVCDGAGEVHAFFAFIIGEEPSYRVIDGAWLNERRYGTIHRLASDGSLKGVFDKCLLHCEGIWPDIRADTHEQNAIMRHLLEKHGFIYCGLINLDKREGDTLRMAYQYSADGFY